jgi:hypothetical protein
VFSSNKRGRAIYLGSRRGGPHQTVSHKSHIPKVLFLAANGRPRWDAGRNQMFHGKVDMWPIARQIPAARSSRNRPAGTLEWKSHLLTKEVYTTLVFEKLVPVILANWPCANKWVLIQ